MKPNQTNGKWWLAAIVLPIISIGVGYLGALSAPFNQDDWLGLRFMLPIMAGLFAGCVLCCIAALISALRRERFFGIALAAAIPSLIFVFYVCIAGVGAKKDRERQDARNAAQYKHDEGKIARIGACRDELRANPALITSDDFWRSQKNDPDRAAQWGLDWVLQDKSFEVTPQIKEYVITNFPGEARWLFLYNRSSHDELAKIVKDVKNSYGIRETAMDCLLRDESFDVTDEWKKTVFDQFPLKIGLLFGGKRFSRIQLGNLITDPKIPSYVKRDADFWLKNGGYKTENSIATNEASSKK